MATLQDRLKWLDPNKAKALTDRINSGQLWDRAQAWLDKFREQNPEPIKNGQDWTINKFNEQKDWIVNNLDSNLSGLQQQAQNIPEVVRPTDTTQANNQVIDTMVESAAWDRAATAEFTQTLSDIDKRREEINKSQQEDEANFAKQKEEMIKRMDSTFAGIEKETQALIDQRLQRDVEDMKALKEAERNKLDAAWDLQRFNDEQALREARQGVLVSQMQANVAMNKLGLAFSTWAINMTQSIATNWFTAIAGLKVQANFNQANFQRDASQLEFDYSTEINRTIDKYTDQQIKLKEQTASRIFDTQNNLLLTEREKIDNINRLKEDYLNSKQATEEQIFRETQAARERAEARAQNIQAEMLDEESRQRTEVARKIQNWSFHLLSASQKKQLADQSNMSVEELSKIEDNFIQSQIYAMAEKIMGEDFLFTMEENLQISNTVKRLIDSGVGMEQAVDRAVADTIRKNPEYQRMQQIKREQESAALRNAQMAWMPIVSSWGGWGWADSFSWDGGFNENMGTNKLILDDMFGTNIPQWAMKEIQDSNMSLEEAKQYLQSQWLTLRDAEANEIATNLMSSYSQSLGTIEGFETLIGQLFTNWYSWQDIYATVQSYPWVSIKWNSLVYRGVVVKDDIRPQVIDESWNIVSLEIRKPVTRTAAVTWAIKSAAWPLLPSSPSRIWDAWEALIRSAADDFRKWAQLVERYGR